MSKIHSAYLHTALSADASRTVVSTAVQIINEWTYFDGLPEFDTIVFRGMSGALIAPRVADRLDKQLLMIRKGRDDSHSGYGIEGHPPEKYLIVDDVCFSGETLRTIGKVLENSLAFQNARCVGILLYHQCDAQAPFDLTATQQKIPVRTFQVRSDDAELSYKNGVRQEAPVAVKPLPGISGSPLSYIPILFKRYTASTTSEENIPL